MREKKMDMLHGSLADKILLFAISLAATSILQQLFNAADLAVVGRFASDKAMAAVGSNVALVGLLVNLFVGISLGANVVIAQALGQGDADRVGRAVHTSIATAILGGVLVCLLGELCVNQIMRWLYVPQDLVDLSRLYLRIYMCGLPVIFLYDFESSIFRSMGDTSTPLVVLAASGVLNVALNVVFVVFLGMSVDGVGLATVISNFASAVALLILLLRTDQSTRVSLSKVRIHPEELREVLRIGLPAGVQGTIFSLSNVCVQSAVNSLGTTVVAASSAAVSIEAMVHFIVSSFGQTCTTFTGQNYGAGDLERCKKVLRGCLLMGAIFTVVSCVAMLTLGRGALGFFSTDSVVIGIAFFRLVFLSTTYPFTLLNEVMSGHLRGFGMSFVPATVSLIGICGIRIFWVYVVFPINPSLERLLLVYPISLCATAGALWMVFLIWRKRLYLA